jgi:hypothetical protein
MNNNIFLSVDELTQEKMPIDSKIILKNVLDERQINKKLKPILTGEITEKSSPEFQKSALPIVKEKECPNPNCPVCVYKRNTLTSKNRISSPKLKRNLQNKKRYEKMKILSEKTNKYEFKKLQLINSSLYPPPNWSIEDVGNWLIKIGFAHYVNKFKNNLINGMMLFEMEYEDIKNIIDDNEDSLNILNWIKSEKKLQLYYINNQIIQNINMEEKEDNVNAALDISRKELNTIEQELENILKEMKKKKKNLATTKNKWKQIAEDKERLRKSFNEQKLKPASIMNLMKEEFRHSIKEARRVTQKTAEVQLIVKNGLHLIDEEARDMVEKSVNIFPHDKVREWSELFPYKEEEDEEEEEGGMHDFDEQASERGKKYLSLALNKIISYIEKVQFSSNTISFWQREQISQKLNILKNQEAQEQNTVNMTFREVLTDINNIIIKERNILTREEIMDLQQNVNVFKS